MKSYILSTVLAGLLLSACSQSPAATAQHISDKVDHNAAQSSIDWSALPSYEHILSAKPLNISRAGTHLISGKSRSAIRVNSSDDVRLILDNVDIRSRDGAAIYIENADNTVIELARHSENYIEDADIRADEAIDGAIYSSDDLMFQGLGKLTVKANYKDAIVSKDDLEFYGGTYLVSSVDDGIRGKDSLLIKGGEISVNAQGDGLKSTNEDDPEKGNLHIMGGTLTIESGDDAIKAVNNITVDGGTVKVLTSTEGMEASIITLNAGDISITAEDDGINAVNENGLWNMAIIVNGGTIDVTVGYGDTDAFDSNGTILITGGHINVTAPTSSFDSDRGAQMSGGTLVVNGQSLSEIPAGRRGGRRGGGRRDEERSRY